MEDGHLADRQLEHQTRAHGCCGLIGGVEIGMVARLGEGIEVNERCDLLIGEESGTMLRDRHTRRQLNDVGQLPVVSWVYVRENLDDERLDLFGRKWPA